MCSIEARTTSQMMDVKWACTGGHSVDSGSCKGKDMFSYTVEYTP